MKDDLIQLLGKINPDVTKAELLEMLDKIDTNVTKAELLEMLDKINLDITKTELKKVKYELIYLNANLDYLNDQDRYNEFADDFLFSVRNYPDFSLVKRFFHIYGMHLSKQKDLQASEDNIDYDKYMKMLDVLYKEADDYINSYKFKTFLLRLFPEHTAELEDKSNILALKLGIDERLFLDNVDSIITRNEKFCIDHNINLGDDINERLSFFEMFNTDFVGSRRFEADEKLNCVCQMVVSNYSNDLRSRSLIGKYDNLLEEFEKTYLFMSDAADIIRLLPNKVAVSYVTTQLCAIQNTTDF